MSTERFPRDLTGGPDPVSNDFEGVVMSGDLFIRELSEGAPARRASEKDEQTTLALGEEGDRGGDPTTLALGEEGDRGGEPTTMAVGEEGDRGGDPTTLAVGEEGDRS